MNPLYIYVRVVVWKKERQNTRDFVRDKLLSYYHIQTFSSTWKKSEEKYLQGYPVEIQP
jgi:hypothetical protein